jgi:hypothetical protein
MINLLWFNRAYTDPELTGFGNLSALDLPQMSKEPSNYCWLLFNQVVADDKAGRLVVLQLIASFAWR